MAEQKGLLIVYTGPGKGKTTCALGTGFRAVGQCLRVLMVQFIKGSWHYGELDAAEDRKSTRLNSSHSQISYAVFCLKKKRRGIVWKSSLVSTVRKARYGAA